jgi:8-oxo-dGTP pyrophosphatase MutT (NUDIX family)
MAEPVPAWFFVQSAVIPYRVADGAIEVALITTRKGRWIIPKGVVDPGETPVASARREALEEAGLVGRIDPRSVGRYAYRKWGGVCEVEVFLMAVDGVHETWPEDDVRDRCWVDAEEAASRMREEDLAALIRRLPDLLASRE